MKPSTNYEPKVPLSVKSLKMMQQIADKNRRSLRMQLVIAVEEWLEVISVDEEWLEKAKK